VGIPVFPSRFFRYSSIFINKNSGIKHPEDLKGKRVGVPDYTMTANTWIRGFLEHDYGVKPTDLQWVTGGLNESGRKQWVATKPIKGLQIIHTETGTLSEMLDKGENDALIGAREPNSFRNRSPNVTRLFPNYQEVETEYYQRTGIFPIMHLIVLKRGFYEENPWLAYSLYKAFAESKEICAREMSMQSALRYMLPWMIPELEETIRIMGEDYWPYGLDANRRTLEAFISYSTEQGLVESPFKLEDMFAPETINVAKI